MTRGMVVENEPEVDGIEDGAEVEVDGIEGWLDGQGEARRASSFDCERVTGPARRRTKSLLESSV